MRILLIILLFSFSAKAADTFYVSTTGNSGNSGSFASPWDLQTALDHPGAVGSDDTIYVLAGTYTGIFTSDLTGTSGHPIIVKGVGRAIIDGTLAGEDTTRINILQIDGAYTWYWGLEVINSDTDRLGSFSGVDGRGSGIALGSRGGGTGVKLINCIIHDAGNGIAPQSNGVNAEIYGCLTYNNGWYATSEGTGHGIYAQNQTGTKRFKENIVLNNFGYGLHFYTESGFLDSIYLEGNVNFNDVWLMGGGIPINDMELVENYSYKDKPQFGYTAEDNDGLILTNNYFATGLGINWFENVTATGNTFFAYNDPRQALSINVNAPPDFSTWAFSGNTYYWRNDVSTDNFYFAWRNTSIADPDAPGGHGEIYLPEWQDTRGLDLDATFETFPVVSDHLVLSGKKVFVRPNAYDDARTNIIIYNWDLSSTVNVDVTGRLTSGDTYELHNVQDYFDDVITGTYTSGNLSVPMTGHTVELPIGYGTSWGTNTFPEFGVFILIKTGSAASDCVGCITPVIDRGQESGIRIKRNTGSALPHVTLRSN